ncbi:MAG: helix-turn-helix transcriptional regulator [Candidatus Omnitrophica bacterium]|nr:helix-turn-helix transcriptional regulator [Candidatus Omnitrophota bacterium]
MLKVNNYLKLHRIKAGLTQLELAKMLGIKERVITFWETGRSDPHITQAMDIARILGVEAKQIFPDLFPNENNNSSSEA